jgi:hypothetical protein
MQGVQEPYREAYYTRVTFRLYVERCGLQHNAADGRFVKAFGFYRQGMLPFIIALPTGTRARSTALRSILYFYNQIFFLPFSHAQFIAVTKIGNANFLINGFNLPVININAALFDETSGFG